MKKSIYFFLIIIIFLSGCSKNTINSSEENSSSLGKVSINIDKINAPSNVALVVVIMTKANSDTITSFMNLSTDTSAYISLQNIAIGTWNLVVLGEDINRVILYRGESNIEVSQGTTTNVELTLNTVQVGTGSINITVNWRTRPPYFTDYSYSPIYTGSDNYSGQHYVTQATILFDNGTYKMWYMGFYNSGGGKIWYAESPDGISWANKYNTPALDVGGPSSWDNLFVCAGAVIKEDGAFKMFYLGGQVNYGNYFTGLATSSDGANWQKYSSPVFAHNSSSEYYIGVCSVLKINNTYFMYYNASPQGNYDLSNINLATSVDGVNWTRYQNNPILSPSLSWEGIGVNYPSVIFDGNQYVMVYENQLQTSFGIAYSPDGIHWTKKYNNPVFSTSNTILRTTQISYPCLIKANNFYRIYYTTSTYLGIQGIAMAQTESIQ